MNPLILRADRLSRSVKERLIVRDVSFEVRRSELLAVVGRSGAGKSSLLRLINRLDEPSSGTVWLGDADYRTLPPRELRRRAGMIMQRAFLFRGTVASNIQYGPEQHGVTLSAGRISELLASVGLEGFENRDAATLSGGEAQRVSFARALANDPELLLLDEPTSSLDETSAQQVESVIANAIRSRGLTCVLVTHNPDQAVRLADRALLLHDGAVAAMDTPERIRDAQRIRA